MSAPPPPLHKEAGHQMRGWYKTEVDCELPPTQVTLKQITSERIELYQRVQLPGENIPIYVEPFQVEYLVHTEDEIEWAVRRLQKIAPGPPLGMRADNLKGWLEGARNMEEVAAKAAEGAEAEIGGPGG